MAPRRDKPVIALALGSGSARGWAHIGVLHELANAGIRPDIVCGSSMGALVGAAYASGHLDELAEWAARLSARQMLRLMDFSLACGGLIEGERLMTELTRYVGDIDIAELAVNFAAVAADLETGREIWLREGPLPLAVRASMALPGLFAPVDRNGSWLVDGGLVNPVPVSLCRAMGADYVIGVNLNGELSGRKARFAGRETRLSLNFPENEFFARISDGLKPLRERVQALLPENGGGNSSADVKTVRRPNMFEVMAGSIDIMQDRITRSRLAGDPPDALIEPRLGHMGLMEFDRCVEAMNEGVASVRAAHSAGALRAVETT